MKAQEIRELLKRAGFDAANVKAGVLSPADMQVVAQMEIAAQLAELNEHLSANKPNHVGGTEDQP